MKKRRQRRRQNPIRFRRCRSDARIASADGMATDLLGLPVGSLRFVAPDGHIVPSTITIGRLRRIWGI